MSMHIKLVAGTPDIAIYRVHVKCDYPVTFLKSEFYAKYRKEGY